MSRKTNDQKRAKSLVLTTIILGFITFFLALLLYIIQQDQKIRIINEPVEITHENDPPVSRAEDQKPIEDDGKSEKDSFPVKPIDPDIYPPVVPEKTIDPDIRIPVIPDTDTHPRLIIPPGSGKIVLVIDDVGYDVSLLEPFVKIPVPITFAVLPGLQDSLISSHLLSGLGQELILHLPMENLSGQDPGPGTLWNYYDSRELLEVLRDNMNFVPGLVGMNNHTGSKGTQDERILSIIMDELASLGLFFLDSRTTHLSKVPEVATRKNLPYLERHVFLDNERDKEAIQKSLFEGLQEANQRGYAVMIGHVWTKELAELIFELHPQILEAGYEFTKLEDLLGIAGKPEL